MKELNILGVRINDVTEQELLELVRGSIKNKNKVKLFTINNEFIVEARGNKEYRDALNASSVSIADSVGAVWAARKILGKKIERIPGADLFLDLLKVAQEDKLKVFLLGGAKGVGEETKHYILLHYSNVEVDFIDGITISADKNNEDIIKRINDFSADMLFVALGAPKQELWITNNASRLHPYLTVGVGGTLDFISGRIKRAPYFMREIGLEWLFRLIQEPSRAKRIFRAAVTFPIMVLKSKTKSLYRNFKAKIQF